MSHNRYSSTQYTHAVQYSSAVNIQQRRLRARLTSNASYRDLLSIIIFFVFDVSENIAGGSEPKVPKSISGAKI